MSGHCEDCGCKVYSGICTNCHEELYIYETQNDYLPDELSDDFSESVERQRGEQK